MVKQRNIALCIVFSILTFGIYGLYWFVKITDELNSLSNNNKSAGGAMAILFCILTCGIYGLYWYYKQGQKIDEITNNNGNTGIVYLLLGLFGLGIIPYCLMQSTLNQYAA